MKNDQLIKTFPLKIQGIHQNKFTNKLLNNNSPKKKPHNNYTISNLIIIDKKLKTKSIKRSERFIELNENLNVNKLINYKNTKNHIINTTNHSPTKIKIAHINQNSSLNRQSNLFNKSSNNIINDKKYKNNEKVFEKNSKNYENINIDQDLHEKEPEIILRKITKVKYNENIKIHKSRLQSPDFNSNKKLNFNSNNKETDKKKNYNIYINFIDDKIKFNHFCKNSSRNLLKKSPKKKTNKIKTTKINLRNNNIKNITNDNNENSKETYYIITNSSKICKYSNTTSNFVNSQNKLSDTNNSNNKCNNSENIKTSSLIGAFKNYQFNFTEQNKEILELLIKNNSNQVKKSLFSDHMNFLKGEKKVNPNLNSEKFNKFLCGKFLESIDDEQQQQDIESNFINFNLGMTTRSSLVEKSLIHSLNKEKTIEKDKTEKIVKTQELKLNENSSFNDESIFSYNDKFFKNINEFEEGENIKKVNHIAFNKFI